MGNELEKLNSFINGFYEKFGNIDPATLTGETKRLYLKAKKTVESAELQKSMMGSVLDKFSEFGVNTIQIGSKSFSKIETPEEIPSNISGIPPDRLGEEKKETTGGQFDDIMNLDDV